MKLFAQVYLSGFILLLVSGCGTTHIGQSANNAPAASGSSISQLLQIPDASQPVPEPLQPVVLPVNSNARYKIGLLVPLTGKLASIGKQVVDATQLAVNESGSKDFQLLPFDTATENGVNTATDAALGAGVNVIIGPVFSGEVTAAAAKAKAANVKLITLSNNKAVAGGNVFVLGPVPDQQVERVVKYAKANAIKGFSTYLPANLFGTQLAGTVRKVAGVGLVKSVSYAADYDAPAKELSEAFGQKSITLDKRSQSLLVAEGGDKLPVLLGSLANVGLSGNSVRLLGTAFWDRAEIITNPQTNGAWFASTPYEDQDAFVARFSKTYNYKPDDIGAIGYDAASLAMQTAPGGFSDAELKRPSGFKGVKGIYKFGRDNVNVRSLAVYEIDNSSAHVIDPANDQF